MKASLGANGIEITHNALKKRVSMALVEERLELVEREKRLTISVTSLSSLSKESLTTSASDDITVTQIYLAGGCHKGSTKAKKKQDGADVSKCIDAIVFEYSKHYNTSKSVGGKAEYGYMKKLIDEKKNEFGVRCTISMRVIQNRTHRGLQTAHHGAKSPLGEVDVALVETCIQMGKTRQPLFCTEAITLMNDMIKNTNTKQKLIEFQQSRKLGTCGFEKGKVTTGWWRELGPPTTIIGRAGGWEDGEGGDACIAVAPRPPPSPSSNEAGEVKLYLSSFPVSPLVLGQIESSVRAFADLSLSSMLAHGSAIVADCDAQRWKTEICKFVYLCINQQNHSLSQ